MRPTKEQIADVVFASIDELNKMLGSNQRLQKTLQTTILKQGSGLDSFGFINLVSLIEEMYFDRFRERIVLTQMDSTREDKPRFESVGSLVEFIHSLAVS
jgi:acyl carrier protein